MSALLDSCVKYFGTRDFYEILNIDTSANENQIKKAYHKLSLLVHPDRVDEDKKLEATEKFKILGKIHSILSDKNKKSVYDEFGTFDEEETLNWFSYWRSIFKKISVEDIKKYEEEYIGSETEIEDVKKAYLNGKGNINYFFETVPFATCEHEPRYLEMIKKLIAKGEVPEYKRFTNEPERFKKRRQMKYAKEKAEVESSMTTEEVTQQVYALQERQAERMSKLIADLETKYGGKKTQKKRSIQGPSKASGSKRARTKH